MGESRLAGSAFATVICSGTDREICLEAVKQDGLALMPAAKAIRGDSEICLETV